MKAGSVTKRLLAAALAATFLTSSLAAPALADDGRRKHHRGYEGNWRDGGWHHRHDKSHYKWHGTGHYKKHVVVHPRHVRHYRKVVVARPYGHRYHGYGHYRRDDDAYQWLAFTAISLGVLNLLSEQQQRSYESAQIYATQAPVGQPIYWSEGTAAGNVVALREGRSSDGQYCREFQQTVIVGGRSEQAYGTACYMPDGAWRVVSSGY